MSNYSDDDYYKKLDELGIGDSKNFFSRYGCLPIVVFLLLPIVLIPLIFSSPENSAQNSSDLSETYTSSSYSYTEEFSLPDYSSIETLDLSIFDAIPQHTAETPSTPSSKEADDITFVSYPRVTRRNENVSVKIKGKPNTLYSITVEYESGPSTAMGLESKYSDSSGYVTWNWHVGGKTNPGTFSITITGGGKTKSVPFSISVY